MEQLKRAGTELEAFVERCMSLRVISEAEADALGIADAVRDRDTGGDENAREDGLGVGRRAGAPAGPRTGGRDAKIRRFKRNQEVSRLSRTACGGSSFQSWSLIRAGQGAAA